MTRRSQLHGHCGIIFSVVLGVLLCLGEGPSVSAQSVIETGRIILLPNCAHTITSAFHPVLNRREMRSCARGESYLRGKMENASGAADRSRAGPRHLPTVPDGRPVTVTFRERFLRRGGPSGDPEGTAKPPRDRSPRKPEKIRRLTPCGRFRENG